MSIRQDLLAGMIRPEILKLAGRRKLLDKCFNEFLGAVYPGASPDQVREMRICFMAGAAELHAVITYGASPGMQVRDTDMAFDLLRAGNLTFHSSGIVGSPRNSTSANCPGSVL